MKKLGCIICLLVLSLVQCEKFQRRDHSLVPPYTGGWTSYGTTMFSPSIVSLTSDQRGVVAGVSNVYPLYSRDWEVIIDFRVSGSTGTLFGDGFAFWYTASPIKPGPALGAETIFRGLGIFYDTYSNHNGEHGHEHPYVSAMVSNGSVAYDHDHDGTQTQLAGCHAPFRNKKHKTKTRIQYSKDTLGVYMDIDNQNEWTTCFEVGGVHLPTGYYLGISAATGDLTDVHEILSLKTYDLGLAYTDEELLQDRSVIEPSADSAEPPRPRVPDVPHSSIWSILFYILVGLFFLGFCMLARMYYVNNQRRKKRLF
ncbi:VIP36-like protein [Taenia solium]|eukprot:TsM_000157100 transcript=TsM_000157100 gene=TsM_000157100